MCFCVILRSAAKAGSLLKTGPSTGVIYVFHWYEVRCRFLLPPPKYTYLNQGAQSINALKNLNALTVLSSSSIPASRSLVLGTEAHCDSCLKVLVRCIGSATEQIGASLIRWF